jgi:hypothetical protein
MKTYDALVLDEEAFPVTARWDSAVPLPPEVRGALECILDINVTM